MILKSEIRNPKSEKSFKYFNFRNFKFVSNFVLRASCLLVVVAPLIASAQGFVPLAPIPGLTDIQYAPNGLADFFNNLYKYLIGLAAVLAVIEIIWGGLEYSTQDSVSKKSDGKERIYQAIFGLVLVLSPVIVFSIINPSILNLSLNLPKLDTKSGSPAQVTPTIKQSCRPGTLNCVNNNQLVGFPEEFYSSPQNDAYCFKLKDGLAVDGKSYYCARNLEACRIAYNVPHDSGNTQTQCSKTGSAIVPEPTDPLKDPITVACSTSGGIAQCDPKYLTKDIPPICDSTYYISSTYNCAPLGNGCVCLRKK